VLIGLSAYGIHRYFIIYLYLKNRKRAPVPPHHFEQLPKVTMQLADLQRGVRRRAVASFVSELDYPGELLQIQVLDDSTTRLARSPPRARKNCASVALMFSLFIELIAQDQGRRLVGRTPRCGRRIPLYPRR